MLTRVQRHYQKKKCEGQVNTPKEPKEHKENQKSEDDENVKH